MVMPLVNLLNSDQPQIQEQTAWALVNISRWKPNKLRMIQDGLLDKLVRKCPFIYIYMCVYIHTHICICIYIYICLYDTAVPSGSGD